MPHVHCQQNVHRHRREARLTRPAVLTAGHSPDQETTGRWLFSDDVFCLGSLSGRRHFHRDFLTFFQRLESFHLDRCVMHENIGSIRSLNETESLIVIKPLDGPFNSLA